MASRRNLKKKITNIARYLFLVSLMEGVNREVVCNSVHNAVSYTHLDVYKRQGAFQFLFKGQKLQFCSIVINGFFF